MTVLREDAAPGEVEHTSASPGVVPLGDDSWGEDPFVPPAGAGAGVRVLRSARRFASHATVSVPLVTLSRGVDAHGFPGHVRLLFAAMSRADRDGVAEFGRGELARLLEVEPRKLGPLLRKLRDDRLIGRESGTTRIELATAEGVYVRSA